MGSLVPGEGSGLSNTAFRLAQTKSKRASAWEGAPVLCRDELCARSAPQRPFQVGHQLALAALLGRATLGQSDPEGKELVRR